MSIGNLSESLSQAMLVGIMLVGRSVARMQHPRQSKHAIPVDFDGLMTARQAGRGVHAHPFVTRFIKGGVQWK